MISNLNDFLDEAQTYTNNVKRKTTHINFSLETKETKCQIDL